MENVNMCFMTHVCLSYVTFHKLKQLKIMRSAIYRKCSDRKYHLKLVFINTNSSIWKTRQQWGVNSGQIFKYLVIENLSRSFHEFVFAILIISHK